MLYIYFKLLQKNEKATGDLIGNKTTKEAMTKCSINFCNPF